MSKPAIDTKRVTPSYDSNKPNPSPINSPKQARDGSKRKGK